MGEKESPNFSAQAKPCIRNIWRVVKLQVLVSFAELIGTFRTAAQDASGHAWGSSAPGSLGRSGSWPRPAGPGRPRPRCWCRRHAAPRGPGPNAGCACNYSGGAFRKCLGNSKRKGHVSQCEHRLLGRGVYDQGNGRSIWLSTA